MNLKRSSNIGLSAIVFNCGRPIDSIAADTYPFANYVVAERYSGTKHLPVFLHRDHKYAEFRSRIRNKARENSASDYAEKYTLVTIGCGADCTFGYLVDLSTGQVRDLPHQGEAFMNLRYDSINEFQDYLS